MHWITKVIKSNYFNQCYDIPVCMHVAARSHVNRLCLAADVPLIESGSAGYQGQVTVIRKVRKILWLSPQPPLLSSTKVDWACNNCQLDPYKAKQQVLTCPLSLTCNKLHPFPSLLPQGHSECYECTPPPATKTFPGCTIRNTPSQPIHCIVWAKHLFSQLFGEPDVDNDVSPETEDPALDEAMDGMHMG